MGYVNWTCVEGHFRNGHWVSPHLRGLSISASSFQEADRDAENRRTPLMRAAMAGDVGRVSQLLMEGADPNLLDVFRQSALYYAIVNGHPEVINILIAHGADKSQQVLAEKVLTAESHRHTLAAQIAQGWFSGQDNFSFEDIKAALECGLEISTPDTRGRTALIRAAIRGDCAAVEFFVQNGAVVNHIDAVGQSALYYAVVNQHMSVASVLERHGADALQRKRAEELLLRVANRV